MSLLKNLLIIGLFVSVYVAVSPAFANTDLNKNEYEVLRLSYGLDCDKHSAKEIAAVLNIEGNSNYVRVSELKKSAVNKLIDNVDHSQVLDYL